MRLLVVKVHSKLVCELFTCSSLANFATHLLASGDCGPNGLVTLQDIVTEHPFIDSLVQPHSAAAVVNCQQQPLFTPGQLW